MSEYCFEAFADCTAPAQTGKLDSSHRLSSERPSLCQADRKHQKSGWVKHLGHSSRDLTLCNDIWAARSKYSQGSSVVWTKVVAIQWDFCNFTDLKFTHCDIYKCKEFCYRCPGGYKQNYLCFSPRNKSCEFILKGWVESSQNMFLTWNRCSGRGEDFIKDPILPGVTVTFAALVKSIMFP